MCSGRQVVVQAGEQFPSSENRKTKCAPPLNVFSDGDPELAQLLDQLAAEQLVWTLGQYLGTEEAPMAELAYKYKYGKPLVRHDQLSQLQTQMRRLHEWYIKACEEGNNMLLTAIREEHYFRGKDEIQIEFEELFQLYNQDVIDKSLVSCYRLWVIYLCN